MLARYELGYKKAQFFPYWTSVLSSMSPVKLSPPDAVREALSLTPEQLHGSKSMDQNSTPVQDDNLHLYGRIQQQVNHQPRRALSTAATMLKLLRKA
ncbi:hypothetical protein C2845_PM08G13190 [Panicum miliaceum]|uniref:Uncharacterized protein n=1 Tax=Panicum miliaceum TaxID=4540 RepID=A0A3L6R069_PANMI|nr:hypothetical protein C2845_PM08G13190 [Panicum miliaceum]